MKTLVQITTQFFENYGSIESPHWKPKGSLMFKMYVDSDDFFYLEEQCIEAIRLLLFEKSNNHERFDYVSHELVFQEPIMIHEKEFQMKLQSVLHTPQLVNE